MSITHKIVFVDKTKTSSRFFCNICDIVLNNEMDFYYSEKYKCCNECYLKFIECQKEIWHTDWKPDKAIVKEYINIRNKLFSQHRSSKTCL